VTFKDVPVGHIFRFMECDCMFRRATVLRANDRDASALVEPCSQHGVDPRFERCPVVMKLRFADPDEEVRYNPLAAMLEEQWGMPE
jgi:hypothetical protein